MTALPHEHPLRVLALVPGMREIGWTYGLLFATREELISWGAHSLPRGTSLVARIRAARVWLEKTIRANEVEEVLLVLPDPHHLRQRKNPTRLPFLVQGLRTQARFLGCVLKVIERQSLKTGRGRPRISEDHPALPVRARWAVAALSSIGRERSA